MLSNSVNSTPQTSSPLWADSQLRVNKPIPHATMKWVRRWVKRRRWRKHPTLQRDIFAFRRFCKEIMTRQAVGFSVNAAERLNEKLNAFLEIDRDGALQRADEI